MSDQPARPDPGVSQSHDGMVRLVLGSAEHAASVVWANLPPALAGRLPLASMTRVDRSFVDTTMRQRHCDVLFSARLDDHDAYVYVLIEHQSRSDPLMAFRMLAYMVRIWEEHLREHPKAPRLPAIIPLVLYQGGGRWSAPTELGELIDLDVEDAKLAEEFLPRFRFLLDDLTRVDVAALRARPLTSAVRVMLVLLSQARKHPNITTVLEQCSDDLLEVLEHPDGYDLFGAYLTYSFYVSETPDQDLSRFAARFGPKAEEAYMTTAEQLRAEGEAKRGVEVLLRLLTRRFGILPGGAVARVRGASLGQLEVWTDRAMDALASGRPATIDEVLG